MSKITIKGQTVQERQSTATVGRLSPKWSGCNIYLETVWHSALQSTVATDLVTSVSNDCLARPLSTPSQGKLYQFRAILRFANKH